MCDVRRPTELTGSISAGPLPLKISVNAQCFVSLDNNVFGLPTPNFDVVTPSRICYTRMLTSSLEIFGSRFALPPNPTLTAASGGSGAKSLTIGAPTNCTVIPSSSGTQSVCFVDCCCWSR